MKKIFLFLTIMSSFLMNAQISPNIEWQKSFGGSKFDYAKSIQQTTDGGYIVAGYSHSNDGDVTGHHGNENYPDYWIAKLDSNGNIQWQKSFGGTSSDVAQSVQQTKDGGFIVAGSSHSSDEDVNENKGNTDFWIVKLDGTGNIQWKKSLGGTNNDGAYEVQQTIDNGFIVTGYSTSSDCDVTVNHGEMDHPDYWIVKLDVNGNIQWQKSLGGSNPDYAYSIRQTPDGGYITAGYSTSTNGDVSGNHGSPDFWIVKLNNNGSIQWQKSFGGGYIDATYSIQLTTDDGYIIAGKSNSINGDVTGNHGSPTFADYWVVKIDNNGIIQWQKSLGGTVDDIAYSVQQTTDGGYIVAGSSNSNDDDVNENQGYLDAWIVKLDSSGNLQWQKSFGGSNVDVAYSIQQTIDGGYIAAGYSASNDGDVTGNHGGYDFWVVKLSPDNLSTHEINNAQINFHPNPVKDILKFSEEVSNIRILDVSGKVVQQIPDSRVSINLIKLSKGIYIVTATTKSGEIISKKIIKD